MTIKVQDFCSNCSTTVDRIRDCIATCLLFIYLNVIEYWMRYDVSHYHTVTSFQYREYPIKSNWSPYWPKNTKDLWASLSLLPPPSPCPQSSFTYFLRRFDSIFNPSRAKYLDRSHLPCIRSRLERSAIPSDIRFFCCNQSNLSSYHREAGVGVAQPYIKHQQPHSDLSQKRL